MFEIQAEFGSSTLEQFSACLHNNSTVTEVGEADLALICDDCNLHLETIPRTEPT
ncbi:hypothetical protein [Nocardia salmonicida]|uniref:hypothetical protein n=1 Tax=Nocardia salmonicida TaxID=53431 RepID=UPI000A9F80C1|nr:hypothetical protein [Nocardia salmonicida]MBC7299815.1 hypothetical protein [Nocardia sp.]